MILAAAAKLVDIVNRIVGSRQRHPEPTNRRQEDDDEMSQSIEVLYEPSRATCSYLYLYLSACIPPCLPSAVEPSGPPLRHLSVLYSGSGEATQQPRSCHCQNQDNHAKCPSDAQRATYIHPLDHSCRSGPDPRLPSHPPRLSTSGPLTKG